MQRQRAAELEINRHLRLDIYALRSPARIERMAIRQLGMVTPAAADALVIERVLPSPAPPRSALARK
jgi:cell division protein FtsL